MTVPLKELLLTKWRHYKGEPDSLIKEYKLLLKIKKKHKVLIPIKKLGSNFLENVPNIPFLRIPSEEEAKTFLQKLNDREMEYLFEEIEEYRRTFRETLNNGRMNLIIALERKSPKNSYLRKDMEKL